MSQKLSGWLLLTTATVAVAGVAAAGVLIWKIKKRVYIKVGQINKLYFFPIKSLKGIEVSEGECTELGFQVKGLLDRSFMLISENNELISQREEPTLALLSLHMIEDKIVLSDPEMNLMTIPIKDAPDVNDKIIECLVHIDTVNVVDCGEEAAKWFQTYLKKPNIRLVRFFPQLLKRVYIKNHPFYKAIREKYKVGLQDFAAFHIMSEATIADVNNRVEGTNISVKNFRPNILVKGCDAYAEDTWEYMKFKSGVEMINILPVFRCRMTTVDPDKGVLTDKEPLKTLRKYRIPKDPDLVKKTGSLPLLGIDCSVLKTGTIKIDDEIFASVTNPINFICK